MKAAAAAAEEPAPAIAAAQRRQRRKTCCRQSDSVRGNLAGSFKLNGSGERARAPLLLALVSSSKSRIRRKPFDRWLASEYMKRERVERVENVLFSARKRRGENEIEKETK